jgi:Transposase DDE domain
LPDAFGRDAELGCHIPKRSAGVDGAFDGADLSSGEPAGPRFGVARERGRDRRQDDGVLGNLSVRRERSRWKLRPRQVTGDATYGTIDNIVSIEDRRIRAYLPLTDFDHRTPYFGRDAFAYDAEQDTYRCPGDKNLRLRALDTVTRVRVYRAPADACAACPLKPKCTGGRGGRFVHRSFDEAYLERVRDYHATEPYQKAIRKRRVWVKPLFAEGKAWHGLDRFRLRGLEKVNGEAQLIAAGQNFKRLLSHRGWGRRPWPSGAAGIVLPGPAPLPAARG